jgi:hypothetical protein
VEEETSALLPEIYFQNIKYNEIGNFLTKHQIMGYLRHMDTSVIYDSPRGNIKYTFPDLIILNIIVHYRREK